MAVDLLALIKDDRALEAGGFKGAVFFTYSLNLSFFETLVAPALEQAGCSNVLILTDPDGYYGAMEIGTRSINGVGRRYVCVPIERPGYGVQHAKMLLMLGPKHGRLLIGSGNLTMHGYGRNLELYSHFEYDTDERSNESSAYPFVAAWQLVQRLVEDSSLPTVARRQITAMKESVSWLPNEITPEGNLEIWHNYDESLLDQLRHWRAGHLPENPPAKKCYVIAPYYDKDTRALGLLWESLSPDQTAVYVDPNATNLNGSILRKNWQSDFGSLNLFSLNARREEKSKGSRALHAKALIGIEQNGAWCLSGSANISNAALIRNWSAGGNLELVTFRWSDDPAAFDHILKADNLKIHEADFEEVQGTEEEPSERISQFDAQFTLSEVTLTDRNISGIFTGLPGAPEENAQIHLLRTDRWLPAEIYTASTFRAVLADPLEQAEAVCLQIGDRKTPYRWIDQPAQLNRYGARSFHARVKGKIETFDGARSLFIELMNFLMERIDPKKFQDQAIRKGTRQSRTGSGDDKGLDTTPPPPPPSEFITDSTVLETTSWGIDQQIPYERSVYSLRDLLSIVLLRLTTPTETPQPETDDWDEEDVQQKAAEAEAQKINILESIRRYLLQYSRRYGQRLLDNDFVTTTGPDLLFQNHFTFGRVLLEFAAKAEVFTRQDLEECFWWAWAPLAWPQIIGINQEPDLIALKAAYPDQVRPAWDYFGLGSLTPLIMTQALGSPPEWKSGLWQKQRVQKFLAARRLVQHLNKKLGGSAFELESTDILQSMGIHSLKDLTMPAQSLPASTLEELARAFSKITHYQPPAKEKLEPLLQYLALEADGNADPEAKALLFSEIKGRKLEKQLAKIQEKPAPIVSIRDEEEYCPKCFCRLTDRALMDLKRGSLVLCTSYSDAWIYQVPALPENVLQM